ncbi:MAG: hypothetical protein ACPGD5_00175 [Salibacteraceae bacterium]
MNFIKPQSLKCHWYNPLPVLFIALLFIGCNPKPDACVEVSPKVLQLGEVTTITDCSTNGNSSELKTGEGGSFSEIDSKQWFYITPGSYNVTLKTYSKNGNKDDKSVQQIKVLPPDSTILYKKWRLSKVELREELFVNPSINIYENLLVETDTLNEVYSLRGDSMFVQHYSDNFNLFLNDYKMDYQYSTASLVVGNENYEIVSFTSTNMVWKGPFYKGYSLLYLSTEN